MNSKFKMSKRNILIDMSATIIHHGHIRLINKASKIGRVVIALTRDMRLKNLKVIILKLNLSIEKKSY